MFRKIKVLNPPPQTGIHQINFSCFTVMCRTTSVAIYRLLVSSFVGDVSCLLINRLMMVRCRTGIKLSYNTYYSGTESISTTYKATMLQRLEKSRMALDEFSILILIVIVLSLILSSLQKMVLKQGPLHPLGKGGFSLKFQIQGSLKLYLQRSILFSECGGWQKHSTSDQDPNQFVLQL